jgi:hypothetical protein
MTLPYALRVSSDMDRLLNLEIKRGSHVVKDVAELAVESNIAPPPPRLHPGFS